MNIKDAKTEVENAVRAYLIKDRYGKYKIDRVHQRPVLVIGAPGIGKTAIMEQISKEMGIGLVSYSMTHHTRQSAIGLPFIEKKTFEGREYSVSEYTMSEIISSIYKYMEDTGVKEGILFLDEINCVSETLSPAMLQFLQYKTFGNTPVPEGWVIVTAGNPPEFNKSVREFDVVTLDRVKKIEVEPDFDVWKEYALKKGIHSSIITYLEIKKSNFYFIESTVDGKAFVTARGWEDLSDMIYLYEETGVKVNERLCRQYIQHKIISKDFAVYYDLFNKYRSDYKVIDILNGKYDDIVKDRAQSAKFDERLTLMGLLLDSVTASMKNVLRNEKFTAALLESLKEVKEKCAVNNAADSSESIIDILGAVLAQRKAILEKELSKGLLRREDEYIMRDIIASFEGYISALAEKGITDKKKGFAAVKKSFDAGVKKFEESIELTKTQLDNMFVFVEEVFGRDKEMLVIVTDLTANFNSAEFIGKYGCDKYFENNKEMLFYERQQDIVKQVNILSSMM
ncbi:AAA family ATPase [Lachnospiraceae bacterium NSJ-143]|nr:AAA family ATPase [Lachnospiraceae bacterium NSJ-143]